MAERSGGLTAAARLSGGAPAAFVAVDWGTIVARRAQKSPPAQGGWHVFHTNFYGVDCMDPTSKIIRANGDKAFFGWPNIPDVETEVTAWYESKTLDEEKGRSATVEQSRAGECDLRPAGRVLTASSLAQERFWGAARSAAVLLGRQQDCVMC